MRWGRKKPKKIALVLHPDHAGADPARFAGVLNWECNAAGALILHREDVTNVISASKWSEALLLDEEG